MRSTYSGLIDNIAFIGISQFQNRHELPRIEGNGEFISHLRGQDRGSLHGVSLFCAIDASAALRGISQD